MRRGGASAARAENGGSSGPPSFFALLGALGRRGRALTRFGPAPTYSIQQPSRYRASPGRSMITELSERSKQVFRQIVDTFVETGEKMGIGHEPVV